MDDYCNFCGASNPAGETHDKKAICEKCAEANRLCEICGSVTLYLGQHPNDQPHYNEYCFK